MSYLSLAMNLDKTSHDTSVVAPKLYTNVVTRACLYFYWDADLFVDDFVLKTTGGMMKMIITFLKRTFSQELIAFYNYNIYNGETHNRHRRTESSRYSLLNIIIITHTHTRTHARTHARTHTHTHTNQYYVGERCWLYLCADLKEEAGIESNFFGKYVKNKTKTVVFPGKRNK